MDQSESSSEEVRLRAVSGAATATVLSEVMALHRRGIQTEVSLAAPCPEEVHCAFLQLDARVLVESLDSWIGRFEEGVEVFVVGPTRAATATWRKLTAAFESSSARVLVARDKLVEHPA